jgi:3-oxoacyl-(acyl-carrier-protein) synthase
MPSWPSVRCRPMAKRIVATSFGFIDATGFGGKAETHTWSQAAGDMRRNLRWRMVSQVPHERFGRLDLLSKYVTVAVEMLGLPFLPQEEIRLETAVVMGTIFGCHGADLDFYQGIEQGEGASPTLFAYTLPSIAVGEIAIRHRLGGPSYCFMAGADSGLLALWESIKLLQEEELASCICLVADVFPPAAEDIANQMGLLSEKIECHAYAFLMEDKAFAQTRGRLPLAEFDLRPASGTGRKTEPKTSWGDAARMLRFLKGENEDQEMLKLFAPPGLGLEEMLTVTHWRERDGGG